jgi:hypothetical protein
VGRELEPGYTKLDLLVIAAHHDALSFLAAADAQTQAQGKNTVSLALLACAAARKSLLA